MMLIINKNGYDENKVKNQRYYEACSGLLVSFGIEMNCYYVILKYNRLFGTVVIYLMSPVQCQLQ